ncbi:MAG: CHRD domain-containing protein [Sphingosinicella sp.]|nr:CHRD domain-containing protein [Sphingosinicella sp.]
MRKIFALAVALPMIALPGCSMIDHGISKRFATYLTGGLMAPGVRGDPDASGMVLVWMGEPPGPICYNVSVRKTAPVIEAHLHRSTAAARWAADGPVIATLKRFRKGESNGCFRPSGNGRPDLRRELEADPSIYYIDVHTVDFPGGALRGKIERSKPDVKG